MTTYYVLGFLFGPCDRVALIQKARPAWQAGLLNGIGGKVENEDISTYRAMSREFLEETGVSIHYPAWTRFAVMEGEDRVGEQWVVTCFFSTVSKLVPLVNPDKEEPVIWFSYTNFDLWSRVIPNLRWLIPLALQKNHDWSAPVKVRYLREV